MSSNSQKRCQSKSVDDIATTPLDQKRSLTQLNKDGGSDAADRNDQQMLTCQKVRPILTHRVRTSSCASLQTSMAAKTPSMTKVVMRTAMAADFREGLASKSQTTENILALISEDENESSSMLVQALSRSFPCITQSASLEVNTIKVAQRPSRAKNHL